jgi:site-specific recombinase XerD
MTDLSPVLAGAVVGRLPAASVRDVDPGRWDEAAARQLAVDIWIGAQLSEHTKAAYSRDIAGWLAFCDEQDVPVNDARRGDVDAWREEIAPGLSPATIARRLSTVSSFYRYWDEEGMVARNPAANAKRPKVSAKPVSISLDKPQASQLLTYVDGLADRRPGVIYRLLAQTGMRVGELTAATVPDLAMSGGHHILSVTRKGGEREQLLIVPTTYERVMAYLDGRPDGYILHVARTERRTGDGQMDRSYVRQLLRRLAREAGLPAEVWQRMHPHVLRHSVATLLAADNVPVPEIQAFLGHASLQTTQRYIHHAKGFDKSPGYRMAALLAE